MDIIWIHGFGEDESVWRGFLPLLDNYHSHFIFTHHWRIGHTSITEYAKDLEGFILENKIKNPVVIGHSMGGYIAVEFAARNPSVVSGLGFFHSSAAADSDLKKKERMKTQVFLNKYGVPAFMKGFYPNMFGTKFKESNSAYVAEMISKYSAFDPEAMISATESMKNRNNHVDTLAEFDFPVFQILGKSDPFVPLEVALEQTLKLKRPSVLLLDDIGHCGMLERPEICADFIQSFLGKV